MSAVSHPLAGEKYVSLTTFRASGEPVSTPVWIALAADHLVVITLDDTGKVKRIGRDPRVELRPCDVRGRVRPDAPTFTGTAAVVREAHAVQEVKDAMSRKYPLARAGSLMESLLGRLMRRAPRVALRLTMA